jgi:hypothetical protein
MSLFEPVSTAYMDAWLVDCTDKHMYKQTNRQTDKTVFIILTLVQNEINLIFI